MTVTTLLFLLKWLCLLTGADVWSIIVVVLCVGIILWLLCPAEYKR